LEILMALDKSAAMAYAHLPKGRKEFTMEPVDETLVLACRRRDAASWGSYRESPSD
jgi:hypothetical protein